MGPRKERGMEAKVMERKVMKAPTHWDPSPGDSLFVLSFSQLVFHMHLGRRRINPSVTAIAWCLLLTPVPFCLPSSFSSINYLWFTFWKLAITGESPLLSSARAVGVGVRGSHEKKEKNQGERNVWVIGKQQSWKKGSEFYFWLLL